MSAAAGFKNPYLSYSRLACFERCPAAFKLRYIDKREEAPSASQPLSFGKAIHAVLERLVLDHVRARRVGPLSEAKAVELWREAWSKGDLVSAGIFEEGLELLRAFIEKEGALDHRDVLAVEQRFEFELGPFKLLGFIDRVDRIDHETIEIIDYKTNRQLTPQGEADRSLQMSIYHLAARQLWPWAEEIRLSFEMLRHGVRVSTRRAVYQLEDVKGYIETLGRMTEAPVEHPARLGAHCAWCDHRLACGPYAEALRGERRVVCGDLDDLEAASREREDLAQRIKVMSARKRELEEALKARLETQDELLLGDMRYQMRTSVTKVYPLNATLELLSEALSLSPRQILQEIAVVDKKALDRLVKGAQGLGKQEALMLRAELDALAERRLSQRFFAKAASR